MGVQVTVDANGAASAMIPSGSKYPYMVFMDASENVTLSTADGSNPRIDLIVAYIDLSIVSSASSNNPGAFLVAKVNGTPAGSPTVPNGAAIQAVIGASNPYIILARVAVAAGATTITNSNITDTRNFAQVTATNIDFGTAGSGIWWQEIGRTTLGSAGDTISVTSLPARKYLMIIVSVIQSGSNDVWMRFNNDTASNYSIRYSGNNAADTAAGGQTAMFLANTETSDKFVVAEIINIAAKEKQFTSHATSFGTAGAANAPTRWDAAGKWANTSAQISRIDIVNFQSGDFATGSEVIVLGHD